MTLKSTFKFFIVLAYFPLFLWGQEQNQHSHSSTSMKIDQQLQQLKQTLHRKQLEEMRKEVDSQEFMIADWPKYSQEVEKVRDRQEEIEYIQKQIQELEQRKAQLPIKENLY